MRSSTDYFITPRMKRRLAAGATAFAMLLTLPVHSFALSELGPGRTPTEAPAAGNGLDPSKPGSSGLPDDVMGLPDPDPLIDKQEPGDETAEPTVEAPTENTPELPPAEVLRDIDAVPEPVRRMRQLIIEAAASGDITRLKPLLNPGPNQTMVMTPENDADPVEALKALSGDPEGDEILAIMLDILSTGFVKSDAGTPEEAYVWPYFAEKSVTTLTPPEKVELLRIITAGDFADMQELGNYNFFRIGISPDGQWKFFTAGD